MCPSFRDSFGHMLTFKRMTEAWMILQRLRNLSLQRKNNQGLSIQGVMHKPISEVKEESRYGNPRRAYLQQTIAYKIHQE